MYRFLFFLLLMAPCACQNKPDEVAALKAETERIHDEAMKDLATMNRKSREIKKMLETAGLTDAQNRAYQDTLASMAKAESDMYDWMRNYKAPAKNTPAMQAIQYLNEQKSKIQSNAEHIRSLIK